MRKVDICGTTKRQAGTKNGKAGGAPGTGEVVSRLSDRVVRVGMYLRVSTQKTASKQDVDNQRIALRSFCERQNWNVVDEYVDWETGKYGPDGRPEFARLLSEARLGKMDVVLFWSLDRFSREGVFETHRYLKMLDECGVRFKSYTEQYLDSCGMFREAVISILAAIAKQERIRQSERVKAGLDRRRAEGRHVGRAPRDVDIERLRLAVKADLSLRQIAQMFGVARSTAGNYVKLLKAGQEDEIKRLNGLVARREVGELV